MEWEWIEDNIAQQTNALANDNLQPPCVRCRNWNPKLTITTSAKGQKLESVQMCVAAEQHHDFSCFEKHSAQTNLDRKLEKFKNNKDAIEDIAHRLGKIGVDAFKGIAY